MTKPIPVPIPLDLAGALGVHPSNLSHVNAGRRHLSVPKAIQLMGLALTDDRLIGLSYYHLRPEQKAAHPYVCLGCPHKKKVRR